MLESKSSKFVEAYAPEPEVEQWVIVAATVSVVLHFGIMLYLLLQGGFSTLFTFLYLLSSVVVVAAMVRSWLRSRPHNRKHLTLTEQGVRYRTDSRQKVQSFDWNEVDQVQINGLDAVFLLKNEECHHVRLDVIRNAPALKDILDTISAQARKNGIKVV